MRTNAIVRVIIFSIVIVLLLGILAVGIAADRFMFRTENGGTASSTGTADAGVVHNLSIEWAAGDITIRPADVDVITLTETGAAEDDPMVWIQSGDTLKVASVKEDKFFHIGGISTKDLLIEVPRDWSCSELEIETAAADLTVDHLTISKVEFDGASGMIQFNGCTVDTIDIDTASGNLYFDGGLSTLECDAASADCEIILTNAPTRIDMDMASGDLDLTLPEGCGFTAALESLSGNLNTDFDINQTGKGFVHGDGACRIDVSAMSGDVFIHKLENLNCDH